MSSPSSSNQQAAAKRPQCPACKSYHVMPVPHGKGTERRKYDPDYACLTCGMKWRE